MFHYKETFCKTVTHLGDLIMDATDPVIYSVLCQRNECSYSNDPMDSMLNLHVISKGIQEMRQIRLHSCFIYCFIVKSIVLNKIYYLSNMGILLFKVMRARNCAHPCCA